MATITTNSLAFVPSSWSSSGVTSFQTKIAALRQTPVSRSLVPSSSLAMFDPLHLAGHYDDDKDENSSFPSVVVEQQHSNAPSTSSTTTSTSDSLSMQHAAALAMALMTTTVGVGGLVACPLVASAATAFTPNAIGAALAAYGHYISIFGMLGCIVAERCLIQPNLSDAEEERIVLIDTAYGVFGLITFYTGYLRLTEYEKGWEFYSHEPLFWVKIALLGVFGASSFFNTGILLKRVSMKRGGGGKDTVAVVVPPMGEKLVARMHQICNAELTALAFIPLTATFMARGVGYNASIPWQAEAFVAFSIFAGLTYKYIKEALEFEDTPAMLEK
jgi:putative membrane protein